MSGIPLGHAVSRSHVIVSRLVLKLPWLSSVVFVKNSELFFKRKIYNNIRPIGNKMYFRYSTSVQLLISLISPFSKLSVVIVEKRDSREFNS